MLFSEVKEKKKKVNLPWINKRLTKYMFEWILKTVWKFSNTCGVK